MWCVQEIPTILGHHKWLSPSRCFRLHDTHRLGLKLRQNFPVLNTGEKKKKNRKSSLFPKSTKSTACSLPQSKTLLPDKRKSNWEDESVSSKNLLFTPKSKLWMNSFIQQTTIDFWIAQCFSLSTKLLVSIYIPNGRLTITYTVCLRNEDDSQWLEWKYL